MTDERITAYLLEELTEQESEQLEEQCFAQEEWPAQFDSVEQELIDAYLRNELTSDRRRRFKERYLTTDARKARVLAAKTIHQVLCPETLPKVSLREKLQAFFQRPLVPQAVVAVLVLAISIPLVFSVFREGRSPQTFTSLHLAMSASDRATGSQPQKITLPLSTEALEILLKLPEQSPDVDEYRVRWEDINGVLDDLKIKSRDGENIRVVISAAKLHPGNYVLRLSEVKSDGTEQRVGNYFFTAEEVR